MGYLGQCICGQVMPVTSSLGSAEDLAVNHVQVTKYHVVGIRENGGEARLLRVIGCEVKEDGASIIFGVGRVLLS